MRNAAILLIIASLVLPGILFSQEQTDLQEMKVFLNAKHMNLESALSVLSENHRLKFVYRPHMLRDKRVDLYLPFTPLDEVLHALFSTFQLTHFYEPDSTIVIAFNTQERWTLTGVITDAVSREPLTGVNVYVEGTYLGDATDRSGRFRVAGIPPEPHRLVVRMMGYEEISEYIFHEGVDWVERDLLLEPSAVQMQEIRIVAKRDEVAMTREVSAYSLNPRNISVIPSYGESDIFRAIQFIPGVTMTSEFKSQLYIRGGNSDQNLVLLDGGIIYNPFHFSGILSAFDVDAVESIDLFAGGFRAEYGSRLSSVLDIQTRGGAEKFGGKVHVSPISAKGMLEGNMGKWGNYLFTGRHSYPNAVASKMGGSVEPNFFDGIGRIEVRPTWKDRIVLSGFYGHDQVQLQDEESGTGIVSENMSGSLSYSRTFGERLDASLRANYGEFKNDMPQPLNEDEPQKNRLQDIAGDFKAAYKFSDAFSLKAGVNYHQIWIKYRSADPIITELNIDQYLKELAFFVQGRIKIGKQWQVEPGLRATRYNVGRSFMFEPRINLRYDLFNFLTLKGAYGHFSQNLVTIYNENDNYNPVDVWLPPDPALPTATADHVILGCMYNTYTLIVSAEMYWKGYDHLTHYNRERIDADDPYFVQGTGDAIGFDLSMQLIKEKWQLWISYALGSATKTLPVQYPEPGVDKFSPRYDRRHSFNASFEYKPFKDFTVSARFSIGSGLPFSFTIGGYYRWSTWVIDHAADYSSHHPEEPLYYLAAIKSERDAFRFPTYHRLDVSVKYAFQWGAFTFKPYAQVLNLYDQPNVLYYDTQGNPHTSLPFLPMGGMEIVW